jgi:hypothetical protein
VLGRAVLLLKAGSSDVRTFTGVVPIGIRLGSPWRMLVRRGPWCA